MGMICQRIVTSCPRLVDATSSEAAKSNNRETFRPVDRRSVILWEFGALLSIVIAASALHFLYELSGFRPWATVFGSVNESTFEHLKLFYWPALGYALVQYGFQRDRVHNFWWGKGLAAVTSPFVLMLFFYCYLGVALPIFGHGFLFADIASGVVGVIAGNVVSYRVLTSPERGKHFARIGLAIFMAMGLMFIAFTFFPPRLFLFENFAHYRYNGEYGSQVTMSPF